MKNLLVTSLLGIGLSWITPAVVFAQPVPNSPAAIARHGERAVLPSFAPGRSLDGFAWAPPSTQFPQGTLLLAYSYKNQGATITEWNAEKATVIQKRPLKQAGVSDVRIARRDTRVVVVTSQEKTPVRWYSLTKDLRVERQGNLDAGMGAVIASSDSDTFLAWLHPDKDRLLVVRLDPVQGKILARREISLDKKVSRLVGEPACKILLSGERLYLLHETSPSSRLISLSLDLKDMVTLDTQKPHGTLLQEQGAILAIPGPSEIEFFSLSAPLTLSTKPRIFPWLFNSIQPQFAFDQAKGLALSDGQVFDSNAQVRRALVPPFADVHHMFWAHGALFLMATDSKVNDAYLLWAK